MNALEKIILKLNDPIAYKHYKFEKQLGKVTPPRLEPINKPDIRFKHSGNVGDIIYALPCVKAMSGNANIHFHLKINQKGSYGKMPHPLGKVMLNERMVEWLRPLLLSQSNIKTCDILTDQDIDVDLDMIREYPLLLDRGNIVRWYFLVYGVNFDLNNPWLSVTPNKSLENGILVARSRRYHTPRINYRFLNEYPEVHFIGLPDEYEEMKKQVPGIILQPVNNFLELAQLIAGCKLFIGNQSFPFSIAEALKVNRLLEVYFRTPHVIVYGDKGYDFCFQPQFEKLVHKLYNGSF